MRKPAANLAISNGKQMISVDDAWQALAAINPQPKTESVDLRHAVGRVLAGDITAQRTQPPSDVSAMDGYALRFDDITDGLSVFEVIGEAPAGGLFDGTIGRGQAVRIFTGGSLPDGGTHVVIQEDTQRDGAQLHITAPQETPRHIRKAGQDFKTGDRLLSRGHKVSAADVALIANANLAQIDVLGRPRVAFIASGDEIVAPGQKLSQTQIPDSISAALAIMVEHWGGVCVASERTPDDMAQFTAAVQDLPQADIIVPIGGASVGDYDYAKQVFYDLGYVPVFEKIAVKPGKPCWFATRDDNLVLGLPGNPSSAMVTATLFLRPLIAQLSGWHAANDWQRGVLAHPLDANGGRESYLRGVWQIDAEGRVQVSVSPRQDSALTTVFAEANCLVRRHAHAPACAAGDVIDILSLV